MISADRVEPASGALLSGKRVLFIAPMFFGYEQLIVGELKAQGAQVDYFNDRPKNDFITKSLVRIDRRLIASAVNTYYDGIIQSTSANRYDHILIVRGEAISLERIRRLKQAQPAARLSLYLWDSMHYNPNARDILGEFDDVFSFDRVDADSNPKIEFLPLFYGREFERSAEWRGTPSYDVCFIGTLHTDRYKVLEKVIDLLEARGRKVFVYGYYPSKTLFRLRSIFDPGFRKFAAKHVRFTGMKLPEVVDRIAESRAVIDINRPKQLGLTMRTIEAVGAQRRLITTNVDIANYDIFSPHAIRVLDRHDPVIDDAFLDSELTPFDESVRQRYSVSAWVSRIFGRGV
jgi:hypothetical protein